MKPSKPYDFSLLLVVFRATLLGIVWSFSIPTCSLVDPHPTPVHHHNSVVACDVKYL